jgi:ribosomal protein S18 acetylase RimI-like enzyme
VAILHLPPVAIEGHEMTSPGSPEHPMRIATHRAAGLHEQGWTDALRDEVAKYFDDMAGEWHTRVSPERSEIVRDAFARGLDAVGHPNGLAVELGSGTGAYSGWIEARFDTVLAIDLSMEMLKRAPSGPAHRVQADGAHLPLRDASAAAVVLINAFLFPGEIARVLAPDGVLVWVNSSGEQTPIHLPVEDLVAQLPGEWNGVSSRAGAGLWCVLRRAPSACTIARAGRSDAPEIARLLTQLARPFGPEDILSRWDRWCAEGNQALLALRGNGSAAGLITTHVTVVLHRPRPLGRITSLIVDEPDRGHGVGRALVTAAEGLLRDAGCGMVEITSNATRVDAHAFYRRIGYEQTSVRFMKELDPGAAP